MSCPPGYRSRTLCGAGTCSHKTVAEPRGLALAVADPPTGPGAMASGRDPGYTDDATSADELLDQAKILTQALSEKPATVAVLLFPKIHMLVVQEADRLFRERHIRVYITGTVTPGYEQGSAFMQFVMLYHKVGCAPPPLFYTPPFVVSRLSYPPPPPVVASLSSLFVPLSPFVYLHLLLQGREIFREGRISREIFAVKKRGEITPAAKFSKCR